ncbi:hypothetical protein [Nonomuraea sp. NPDC050786]|uniref:hypothetical protein n=1 Tax=Nonomuraea sp. NPDC050786 TaxID=3154840 RepID=UPI0033CFCE34
MTAWIPTIGVVVAALLGGGIVRAFVEYARNRQVGRLESHQFDFSSLREMNEIMKKDLAGVREELAQERALRRSVEEVLARVREELDQERKLRRALEVRVAELERAAGGTHGQLG